MQIIKVGFVSSEKTRNCADSPNKLLSFLRKIETNEKGTPVNYNSLSLEEIHVNLEDVKESDYLIFENSKEIFERNYKSFFIGGDHSITYPIIRAFNKIEKNPFLIVFDAHTDCSNSDEELNRSWIRKLVDSGFNPSSVIIVSSRNILVEELKFLKNFKIQVVKMDILQEELEGMCDIIMERARNSSGFYISIDVSCLDSAFSPGAIDNEPGGLSSRELIYFLKRLVLLKNFRGADIVEIDSNKDLNDMTMKLGAKLLADMIY
jgi:arginase